MAGWLDSGETRCYREFVSTLRERVSQIPDGAGVLFFVQLFATLGFAVLYSTLVLYATQHLHFPAKDATTLMGVFGAFNYGLHLFGGYLGGRFLSNRNLFVGGMILQVLGCACISGGTVVLLYIGLALFLTGSGLNVTCINMMLTQRFKPEDSRREGAFLWNYAGMNIGFFIGFTAAGHYQKTENYSGLFIFATIGNLVAIVLAFAFWKTLADRETPLLEADTGSFRRRFVAGVAILFGLVPVVWFLLQHPHGTERLVKGISAAVALALLWLTLRHRDRREQNNMWAYLILTLGSLVFWALYQMAPSGLQLFAVNNVDRKVWGIEIAPQWIQNINTIVIVVGGPLMSALFVRLRKRGWKIDVPKQFAASLVLMGAGHRLRRPAGDVRVQVALAQLRAPELGRAPHLARRVRDDRQARPAALSGRDDGRVDAGHRPRLAVRGRLLGHDPGAERGQRRDHEPGLFEALHRARLRQRGGRRAARGADPVPPQADHRRRGGRAHRGAHHA